MQPEDRAALRQLMTTHRQAALGTVDAGAPFVSMVLYALEWRTEAGPACIIHVSGLSAHTRHMRADPRASLLVMQPDTGANDPQALARVTIQCRAIPLAPDDPTYPAARLAYLTRLPPAGVSVQLSRFHPLPPRTPIGALHWRLCARVFPDRRPVCRNPQNGALSRSSTWRTLQKPSWLGAKGFSPQHPPPSAMPHPCGAAPSSVSGGICHGSRAHFL